MKTIITSLAAIVALATAQNCQKGEFPVLHQYDNNGQGACGCAEKNDPCRNTCKGPKGPCCIPADKQCGADALRALQLNLLTRPASTDNKSNFPTSCIGLWNGRCALKKRCSGNMAGVCEE